MKKLAALAASFGVVFALAVLSSFEAVAAPPRPTEVAAVYDVSTTGAANVLTSSLTMTAPSSGGVMRVQIGITSGSADSIYDVELDDGNGAGLDFAVNDGTALGNGELYAFTILVPNGWTLNVSPRTTTRQTLVIQELHEGL